MQITSGKFESDLFAMANGTEFKKNSTYDMVKVEHKQVGNDGKVVLAEKPVQGSVYIKGLSLAADQAQAVTTGYYKFDSTDQNGKTIMFFMGNAQANPPVEGDIPSGTAVEIHYRYTKEVEEAEIDNRSSAIGEAVFVWPVYASADDCSVSSSITGYVVMKVFRCRVTAAPGFDSSYKSANTFQFTLSALDPKRDDDMTYSIAYFENEDDE